MVILNKKKKTFHLPKWQISAASNFSNLAHKIVESEFQSNSTTFTEFASNGKINSPCLKPFRSKKITSCCFDCWDAANKLPEGLKNKKKLF